MYTAVLFTVNGDDWVTDYTAETIEEVSKKINDAGSRWYFYPFVCIVRNSNINYFHFEPRLKVRELSNVIPELTSDNLTLGQFRQWVKKNGEQYLKMFW